MTAIVRLPFLRLMRVRRTWISPIGWAIFAVVAALIVRAAGVGVDRALLGTFGPFVLPLFAFGIVSAVTGGESLASSTSTLRRFGTSPARAALGTIAVACGITAIKCAGLCVVIAALARGPSDPSFASDAFTCLWVGALGGAAYAALFIFGATFGKQGGGRGIVLIANWLLGAGTSASALLVPLANVRNLLGGSAPLGLSQGASALVLVAQIVLYAGLAILRCRKK